MALQRGQALLRSIALRQQQTDQLPLCTHTLRGLASGASGQLEAIKALRERSGAPISEVKAALSEAGWEPEKAYQELRKKGLAAAVKKVNSETDFVARTDEFRSLVSAVAEAAVSLPDTGEAELSGEVLEDIVLADGRKAGAAAQDVAGVLRENIKLRRGHRLACPSGVIGHYLHISPAPGLGRMAALVALEPLTTPRPIPDQDAPAAEALGKQLAMHITAARPQFLDKQSVPESVLDGEREVLRQQAAKTGKPANIIEKMVEGRLTKYYEEVCLLDQRFVMDDSVRIRDVLRSHKPSPLRITSFLRFQCGEGLEATPSADFASEVAQVRQASQA